jgi:hypothetical protein
MKRAASTLPTELPVSEGWHFGGFAYGLEPLILPDPGDPDPVHDDGPAELPSVDAYSAACRRIQLLGERGLLAPEVERCGALEELFWFRWITGHQVCFVIWRLMAQLLDDVAAGTRAASAALGPMCRYMDGYSTMLLYTSSCPRDVYHALIRPSMRLRHRGFSGGWAPDYARVRNLFRRQPSPMWNADTGDLRDSVRLHDLVHEGIAARLVPGGRSLLHQASVRGLNHRLVGMIYDSYFITLRRPVPRHHVVSQLLRRLVAIAQDVAANGLYADSDRDIRPLELRSSEVVRCENNLVGILAEVGRRACGLDPGGGAAGQSGSGVAGVAAEAART